MTSSEKSFTPGTDRRSLGRQGEALAAHYLQERGYQVLERNFRTAHGEIDLVALQPPFISEGSEPVLVFVEVKTRSSKAYGYPEESITPAKQTHLIHSAQTYLQDHPKWKGDWRIDVIAVRMGRSGKPVEIRHFENAVH